VASKLSANTKISSHSKDLIQKYASSLFKNSALEFYGVKAARIKEIISVELPTIEVSGGTADFVFLLEDGTYLHFEFQTTYSKRDLRRFADYDLRLNERDERIVVTVVIYAADVKKKPEGLNIGSLAYNPTMVMMAEYDGNAVHEELVRKIEAGHTLTDVDTLSLIFLPLMRHTIPRGELAVESVKLAQSIQDTAKRNACIAAAFAFGSRYLDENRVNELLEVLRMTDLATLLVEKAIGERDIELARKMLKRGLSLSAVIEDTDLDESTVKRLQTELGAE